MGDVRVELVGDRIWLKAPFDGGAGPKLAKQVPGHNWNKQDKVWTYPLNLHTCRDIRRVYGDRLAIGPMLTAWARSQVKREKEMAELGAAMDADLQMVPDISPRLAAAMASRTYQRSGARFVANGRRVLLADEPSLGKTATALGGLMEAGVWKGSHLIVAPKTSLHSTWARQIELWTGDTEIEVFAMPEGKARREATWASFQASRSPTRILIVNPAMVRVDEALWCDECEMFQNKKPKKGDPKFSAEHTYFKHKAKPKVRKADWLDIVHFAWDSVILDECHDQLANWKPSDINQEREGLSRIQPDVRIALTGTPVRGHEKKLWGTFKWLGQVEGGYWAWIETWFDVDKGGHGWEILGLNSGKQNEFHMSFDTICRRLTKKEARPDLPDKDYQPVWVQLEGRHRKQYVEFLNAGEALISGQVLEAIGVLAEMTRLKQLAFGECELKGGRLVPTARSPKLEWLKEALRQRGVTGNPETEFFPEEGLGYKYVIASQYTEVIDLVERELNRIGIKTLKITGGVTGKRRNAAVETFQSGDGEYRVMLINTTAGGVSIDLDAWCDEMFILDETWINDQQVQLEGRTDNRSGRVSKRTFWYIRTEGTLEEEIAESNLSQDEMQKMLLDRRRGVEVAERIIRKLKKGLTK